MAILQPIVDLAALCYEHGVRHVVISPGSRSAALTLSFTRLNKFTIQICMDERSAAFVALGIAQQTGIPTVLICTSGSAAYNFAPAVAEAFFQQVPLLVLTADRPKEWIHQYDGQTIYQQEIYGKHVKRSFELLPDYDFKDTAWAVNRIANEALLLASTAPPGPVHVNVPIREPFYPNEGEDFVPSAGLRIIRKARQRQGLDGEEWAFLMEELESSPKILIAAGQNKPDSKLLSILRKISEEWDIPVVADTIANLSSPEFIHHHDLFLSSADQAALAPDLLITFGMSFISKDFKQFIRTHRPAMHWHISEDEFLTDSMQSVTRRIHLSAYDFFSQLFEKVDSFLFASNSDLPNDISYKNRWNLLEFNYSNFKFKYINNLSSLNDLSIFGCLNKATRSNFQLQVGNSMSIRYTNALLDQHQYSGIFCNRGTSGIDGCVSTAIGAAIASELPTLLLLGDVSFLYDRNGFLIRELPQHLKIIVLNNAGGNIFRMIDGPGNAAELEKYFETRHSFNAQLTCQDARITYHSVKTIDELESNFATFIESEGIALLEIFTDPYENERVWKELKAQCRKLGAAFTDNIA